MSFPNKLIISESHPLTKEKNENYEDDNVCHLNKSRIYKYKSKNEADLKKTQSNNDNDSILSQPIFISSKDSENSVLERLKDRFKNNFDQYNNFLQRIFNMIYSKKSSSSTSSRSNNESSEKDYKEENGFDKFKNKEQINTTKEFIEITQLSKVIRNQMSKKGHLFTPIPVSKETWCDFCGKVISSYGYLQCPFCSVICHNQCCSMLTLKCPNFGKEGFFSDENPDRIDKVIGNLEKWFQQERQYESSVMKDIRLTSAAQNESFLDDNKTSSNKSLLTHFYNNKEKIKISYSDKSVETNTNQRIDNLFTNNLKSAFPKALLDSKDPKLIINFNTQITQVTPNSKPLPSKNPPVSLYKRLNTFEFEQLVSNFNQTNKFGLFFELGPNSLKGSIRIHMNLFQPIKMLLSAPPLLTDSLSCSDSSNSSHKNKKFTNASNFHNSNVTSYQSSPLVDLLVESYPDLEGIFSPIKNSSNLDLYQRKIMRTSFKMPRETSKLIYINDNTTAAEVIKILLKKFCIINSPKKFALYHRNQMNKMRKLPPNELPLLLCLYWFLQGDEILKQNKLILQENDHGDICWENFSMTELKNCLMVLDREEVERLEFIKNKVNVKKLHIKRRMCELSQPAFFHSSSFSNFDCGIQKEKHQEVKETNMSSSCLEFTKK